MHALLKYFDAIFALSLHINWLCYKSAQSAGVTPWQLQLQSGLRESSRAGTDLRDGSAKAFSLLYISNARHAL